MVWRKSKIGIFKTQKEMLPKIVEKEKKVIKREKKVKKREKKPTNHRKRSRVASARLIVEFYKRDLKKPTHLVSSSGNYNEFL